MESESGRFNYGIQTPSLCAIGNSTVFYPWYRTCVASSTAALHVSKYNTAALSGSIANLCVTSPTVNLMNIVQNTLTGVGTGVNVYPYGSGRVLFQPQRFADCRIQFWSTLRYQHQSSALSRQHKNCCFCFESPVPNIALAGPFCSADPKLNFYRNSGQFRDMDHVFLHEQPGIFTPRWLRLYKSRTICYRNQHLAHTAKQIY